MRCTTHLLVGLGFTLAGLYSNCFEARKKQLLQGKAINKPDQDGRTPFMNLFCRNIGCMPLEGGEEDRFVEYLVKQCGAHINQADKEGRTAVYYALHHSWKYVPILVKCGACLDQDGNGKPFYPLKELFEEIKTRSARQIQIYREPSINTWSVHRFRFRMCIELLLQRGCRIPNEYANEYWGILAQLAKGYSMLQPLQGLIENGSLSCENLEKVWEMSFNVQCHLIPNPDTLHSKQITTQHETKATQMIREAFYRRKNMIEEERHNPNSYFSLLQQDITRLVNDRFLNKPEHARLLEVIHEN